MATVPISKPDMALRKAIEAQTHAQINMCWNCSACDSECPVNIVSNRLRPQKIVHMAYLGLIEELIAMPEIWYCLLCGRCSDICPNRVKPTDIIVYARNEAIRRRMIPADRLARYKALMTQFQHARWHIASTCMIGEDALASEEQLNEWLATPIPHPESAISPDPGHRRSEYFRSFFPENIGTSCFTCSECTNACPIFADRSIFDPQRIVRMVNFGMEKDAIQSPSIWLCIGCKCCTYACSQLVEVHRIIEGLKKMAISEKIVHSDFAYCHVQAQQKIYPFFLKKIDEIFGSHF